MNLLHIVNKSPFDRDSLKLAIDFAQDGASILMIEDGVYGAMQNTTASSMVAGCSAPVYVLGNDLKARGITEDKVLDGVTVIDYAGFVKLTTELDQTQAWL